MELKMCPRHFCRLNKETSRHCQFRPEMGKNTIGKRYFFYTYIFLTMIHTRILNYK